MIENALDIRGFMSPYELQWLAERAVDASVIVEIGSFHGRSTRALADNTKGKVYCIDPWPGVMPNTFGNVAIASGNYAFRQFQKNLADHLATGRVVVHRGTVDDIVLIDNPDFVFIDGNHLLEPFRKDLEWADKAVISGIISGHDYGNADWPAVKQLVDEKYPEIGRTGFIWWTQK